jgi:hypothetical protein
MPLGLRGYRSLLCVVTQSYAVLYGQNQTTGRAHGSEVVGHHAAGWAACHTASSAVHSQLITCLQNTCRLSATVAHLGWSPRRIGQDRLVSDAVVVRIGGQLRLGRPQAARLTLKRQRMNRPLIACLQSMVKMSTIVAGLGRSVPTVSVSVCQRLGVLVSVLGVS